MEVRRSVEVAIVGQEEEKEFVLLKPNEQLRQHVGTKEYEVAEVDASVYTSWKDGVFMFEGERLSDIIKTLERWYGFEASFADEAAKDVLFTGDIKKYDDFSRVLEMLQHTEDITIEIQQNQVIIKNNM